MNHLDPEHLVQLPWHDVARWNARRHAWLVRGALLGACAALAGGAALVSLLPGDAGYRLVCAVSLLAPGAALAALCGHLGALLHERRTPHPLERLL